MLLYTVQAVIPVEMLLHWHCFAVYPSHLSDAWPLLDLACICSISLMSFCLAAKRLLAGTRPTSLASTATHAAGQFHRQCLHEPIHRDSYSLESAENSPVQWQGPVSPVQSQLAGFLDDSICSRGGTPIDFVHI